MQAVAEMGKTRKNSSSNMKTEQKISDQKALDLIAEENGIAIAIVDENARQVVVTNNNSICRNLNPTGDFSPKCAAFCGKALEKAVEAGETIGFECHAGLDCRAIPVIDADTQFVVIAGRTFLKADNYRKATERAIKGDWRIYSPSELFENVLLSGTSDVLDKAAKQVKDLLETSHHRSNVLDEPLLEIADEVPVAKNVVTELKMEKTLEILKPEAIASTEKTAGAQAWRSFFGSILKKDYAEASRSILEFIAHQFNLSALIWLEKTKDRFDNTISFGEVANRKVRLGIRPDDQRLITVLQNESSLEIGERAKNGGSEPARVMNLFPIGVGDDISAAVAVLDTVDLVDKKRQIARFCHSIAPQLEILRLRNEVLGRNAVTEAVREFGNSLKGIDADDFWMNITQKAAEILAAERASLLVMDEKTGQFEIKSLIGAIKDLKSSEEVGGRVAKIVYAKNEAVIVSDITKTGLPPASPMRKYRTSSFISCPISVGSRTLGVMSFTDRADGSEFDRHSLELFQAIAPQLAVAIDRAELKEKAGEFEQLSVTDALTGLLNRRYMEERLSEEIKRSNRHGFPMSFMMLDVDHFKSYNDAYGHPAGDTALKMVAHVIRDTLRSADVAARFGGEEFSILLPQTTGEEAAAIAERIRSNIEHADFPHRLVTTSIGVASCSAELCASADLVSAADKALYEAKRTGRNKVLSFEEMKALRAN